MTQSALDFEQTNELLRSVTIPTAPVVLMDLHGLMQADEPDMNAVADTISRDVGLSALVLRALNSPLFGLRREVNSIRHATSLLGMANITNIVAALAMQRSVQESGGSEMPEFWDSAMNVALVSAFLCRKLGGAEADQAYLLGLFVNAGEPLLAQRFPDCVQLKRLARQQGLRQANEEDRELNTNHAVVGYLMAGRWGLPKSMVEIILHHHDAAEFLEQGQAENSPEHTLMAVLKLAEHIDNRYSARTGEIEWSDDSEAIKAYFNLLDTDLDELIEQALEMLAEA